MKRISGLVLFGLTLALPVYAASFDCAKARTKVEHLICDNPELSKLDEELDETYKIAQQDSPQNVAIKHTQKIWLRVRNACGDVKCIKDAYTGRLTLLKATPHLTYGGRGQGDYVLDDSAMDRDVFEHKNTNEVCNLYLKNLQYFVRRNLPMSCGQPIAPFLNGRLKKVNWVDIDPDKFPALFREAVEKFPYSSTDKKVTEEELSNIRNGIRNKKFVFHHVRFSLVGHPTSGDTTLSRWAKDYASQFQGRPIPELKLTIVQYGPNINSSSNPNTNLRCDLKQIRGGHYFYGNVPVFFLATADLQHLYGQLQLVNSGFPQYLWRINGNLYGEAFHGGDIQLSELGGVMETNQDPFFFESVCLYHYEVKLNSKGNE